MSVTFLAVCIAILARPDTFARVLPDGSTLTLLAVSDRPCSHAWSPQGRPSSPMLLGTSTGFYFASAVDTNRQARNPLIEMVAPHDGDLAVRMSLKLKSIPTDLFSNQIEWAPSITSDHVSMPNATLCTVPILAVGPTEVQPKIWDALWFESVMDAAPTADIEIKVAYGPWKTISRTSFRNGIAVAGVPITLKSSHGEAMRAQAKETVSLHLEPAALGPKSDERLIAFDKNDKATLIYTGASINHESTEFLVDRLDDVVKVVVQSRPYTVVTFRSVRTRPLRSLSN